MEWMGCMKQNVYEFLARPRHIKSQIRKKETELYGLRMSVLPGGIDYSQDKVQTSPSSDQMAKYAARIDDIMHDIERLQDEYAEAIENIMLACQSLEDIEGDIISMRWVGGMDFGSISEEVHLSERQMFRKYHDGLEKMSVNVSKPV